MSGTRFYIQAPGTGYPSAVIEAHAEPVGDPHSPERQHLVVVAPAEFQLRWPTVLLDPVGEGPRLWQETDGPARMLTHEEWVAIVGQEG